MQEEYKTITGFESYEVSNFGNVKNIKTGKVLIELLPKELREEFQELYDKEDATK